MEQTIVNIPRHETNLFFNNTKGIVVKGNLYNNVGDYDETFIDVTNKTHWRILSSEESIVLTND